MAGFCVWHKEYITCSPSETADELTNRILKLIPDHWDRINFATPEKIDRVARLMHIDHAQIDKMRRETRKGMI